MAARKDSRILTSRATLAFIWRYLSYRGDLVALFLLCAVAVVAAELSIPLFVMSAIDSVLEGSMTLDLNLWLVAMLGVLALLYGFHVGLLRLEVSVILQASYNLRRRLYEHIHAQAIPFFERHSTGALMHRLTSDTEQFEDEAASIFRDLPSEILTVIGVIIMMALLDMRMAALVVGFMSAAAALAWHIGQPLADIRTSAQNIASGLSARLQETLNGVRTVKAFKNEALELQTLDRENRKTLETERREGQVEAWMEPLSDMIGIVGLVLVVWFGAHLISQDALTAGGLIAFIAYMEILARPIGNLEHYIRSLQTCRAVGGRLDALFSDISELPVKKGPSPDLGRLEISFDNVSFRYPKSRRKILDQVSFSAAPGETIAVVGANGAGKSTLTELILRFYDPSEGQIRAGGVALDTWPLEDWRLQIGVMQQDVFLFRGTIAENIAYGRPGASKTEIAAAAEAAGLDRILKRLSQGLNTHLDERGTGLSGGERQTVALARLYLRDPKIAILDEPTAHFDGEALHAARRRLSHFMKGRTVFLITHHQDMTALCERVLYLKNGRLAETQNHETLLRMDEDYQMLWGATQAA
ncbi:MAG: ABC transporter ATP-binding protein [Pseudomonadota bacterium]